MTRLILHRLILSVPLLFVVSVIAFLLQSLIPGDAARQFVGLTATPEQVEQARETLGLDKPLYAQYGTWVAGAFRGDLGVSMANQQPVIDQIAQRLPVTLSLVILATLVAVVVGVLLGVVSIRGNRVVARVFDVLSIGGLALPNFWIALILVAVFAVSLGLFPATGYVPATSSVAGWAGALVLPVAALAMTGITTIAKQTRESMLDIQSSEHVRNLRLNGIPERSVIFRHVLRGSAVRIVTVAGLLFIGALGGSVVVEQVFGLPGLGSLAVNATSTKDIPVIQGVAVTFTLLVVVMNLITDIVYGWLNPRVRAS